MRKVLGKKSMLVVLAVAGAAVAFGVAVLRDRGGQGGLTVEVAGRSVHVADETTFGQATSMLALRPGRGDLLDVEGRPLRRGTVAGRLLLDGQPAPPGVRLRSGDRITVVAGRDRREPLSRQVLRVPGGMASDPQFFLARTPGSQVIIRGAISHKLVSASFHASGGPATVERAVALTFDDGPSPQFTARILATLGRLHVPATFFVVGYLADRYPDLVRQELRAGMTVGNHTYNHPEVPAFEQLPRRLLEDEVALGAQSLSRLDARPTLFRPPGGSFSATVVNAAEAFGERIVLWSVDPADWQPGATARQIARKVLAAVRPGSIVILHDGGGDRAATAKALPAIVKGIRRKGLRLVAITAR